MSSCTFYENSLGSFFFKWVWKQTSLALVPAPPWQLSTGTCFIYIFVYYLRLSIKKGPYRFRVGCLNSRSKKNVIESLNDLKFILYLKYDNFSTTWCMTRLPLLPIIYVRAHYIIQLEIHKNTSYFSGNTDAAVNRMECSDWSIEISKNKLGIFGCI